MSGLCLECVILTEFMFSWVAGGVAGIGGKGRREWGGGRVGETDRLVLLAIH